MADYGLLSALNNMYSGPSQASKNDAEFAKLQQIQSHFEKEKQKKEADAIKMQVYDEQVSKFADNLLAPDRNRIFERSRMLKSSVREVIKANGGDMGKFYENGGHDVLSNYKNSIIQSEESSMYLENKQNMTMILKAMNEGKSHLISPKDKASFDAYFANKGGTVSYSGVMNEIKMPDANKYEYGQQIPLEDILNENKTAILANYSLYYKDTSKDPTKTGKLPSDQELMAFTAANYGTQTGSNYQKKISENQAVTQENQELRTQDMYPIEKEKAVIANKQAVASLESTELQNQKTEMEILNMENGIGSGVGTGESGGSGSGGGAAESSPFGKDEEQYSLFTDAGSAFNEFNSDPNITVGNVFSAMNNTVKGNAFFEQITDGVWKDSGAKTHDFGFFGNRGLPFSNVYKPSAALNLFTNDAQSKKFNQYAVVDLHGAKYDPTTNKVTNFMLKKGMKGVYNWDGKNLENGHTSGNMETTDGEYTIKGTIAAATTNGPNGKAIVMNQNGKLSPDAYNKNDKARMSFFTVMESKFGRRIYVEVNPNDLSNVQALQKPFDYTDAKKQRSMKDIKNNATIDAGKISKQNVQDDYIKLKNRPQFKADLVQLGNNGSYGDPMILYSFYTTIKSASGGNASFEQIADSQGRNLFNTMNKASDNLVGEYANGKISTEMMFRKMLNSPNLNGQEKTLVNQWKSNFLVLKNNMKIK